MTVSGIGGGVLPPYLPPGALVPSAVEVVEDRADGVAAAGAAAAGGAVVPLRPDAPSTPSFEADGPTDPRVASAGGAASLHRTAADVAAQQFLYGLGQG